MLKKAGTVLLSGAVALACLAGCTKPKEKETVELIVKVPTLSMSSYYDSEIRSAEEFIRKAAKGFEESYAAAHPNTEVKLDVIEFEIARETEFISDTFGTPSSPDVLYEGYFNMSTYIYTGRVVPLDDIVSEELRADIAEHYWDLSRVNGKTYMMPFLSAQNTLAFNREIFRQAGLTKYIGEGKDDVVQTWTLDEWEEVLSALKTYCDKNNEDKNAKQIYPMMMYAGNDQGDTHIMTLLRSRGCPFFDAEGKIRVDTEEGVAALQWLKDSADKGYFPKNCELNTINDCSNLFSTGQLAIMVSNPSSDETLGKKVEMNSVNFPSVNGGLATDFVTGFEVFDNGDEKKVALAKEFVKYVYESDYIEYMAGAAPCSNLVAQKYAEQLKHIAKYVNNDAVSWNFTNNSPNWRGVRAVFWGNINDLLSPTQKSAKEVAAAIEESCNAALQEGWDSGKLHD